MGNYSDATVHLKACLDLQIRTNPRNNHDVASTYCYIGLVLHLDKKFVDALIHYWHALDIYLNCSPPTNPNIVNTYLHISLTLSKSHQWEEALSTLQKRLEIQRVTLPHDHKNIFITYQHMALTAVIIHNYADALLYWQQCLDIQTKLLGLEHPDLAITYESLGDAQEKQGNFSDSLNSYQRALDIHLKSLSPTDSRIAQIYQNLGHAYSSLRQREEALLALEKCLEIQLVTLLPDDLHIATTHELIAANYFLEEKNEQALAHAQKCVNIRTARIPPDHLDLASAHSFLGNILCKLQKHSDALVSHQRALDIRLRSLSPTDSEIAQSYQNLGRVYFSLNQREEALLALEECLALQSIALIPDYNSTILTRMLIAKEYQTIQRSIIIDLQKLSDHNLLLSSDVKATEYLQERYNNLKEIHLNLEQKVNHLRERINVSLSINVKIDDNLRQIKRKLILYETDLNHLRNETPNSVSDKRIRAELAVTVYNDLEIVGNLLEELIHDAERECKTSTENILALSEIKIQHEQMLREFKEQVDNSNLIFNEHFNYGESARTLRSFIADVTTELCNLDKQPISTIEKTRELIESKVMQVQRLKVRYDELQPILVRIQKATASDGQHKLLDENQFLFDALQSLENQLSTIHSLCLEKQQAWLEFKLRFDTTYSSFHQIVELYQQNNHELDSLKDIQNELLLLQDHIDYLLQIKSTRFSILTPNDNLFFLDTTIEYDLSQLQTTYRLKLNQINQEIEQTTENKLKDERLKLFIKSMDDSLNLQEETFNKISYQRQLDNETTFENLTQLFQQIEQMQIQLKELSKNFNQISNNNTIEELKSKLERLRTQTNDEHIAFNRLINEYKSLNQMVANYNELNEQINECIVNILQYADSRSRLLTPEPDQRSPTDQLVQLNIYRIQIQEQLTIIEHSSKATSTFIYERFEQLHQDVLSLKDEIESILEKENETTSFQNKVDRLIETLQIEFDRSPKFSSPLTNDTFEVYQKSSNNYLQTIHNLENEIENIIEQFQDTGLVRQYNIRFNQIKQEIIQIESNIKNQIEHLRQGLAEQNSLQIRIQSIIEDLTICESQLTDRVSMKEHQLDQKLQEVQIMLEAIESTIDDVSMQSKSLEQEYSVPQQQTQIKDIQLRKQRVARLIQETSQYLDMIHNKKQERHNLLEQLTNWLELKQKLCSTLIQIPLGNDYSSLESQIIRIQSEHNAMGEGYTILKSIEVLQNDLRKITTDEDNIMLTELLRHYHGQLKTCDLSFVEIISTIRQIQINVSKYDDSCQEVENTIKQQHALFQQFIENNHNISPDNLSQQIQILKNLQREIETKTNSMIDTLTYTKKDVPVNETKLERLLYDNQQLKSAILNEINQRESLLAQYTEFLTEMTQTQTNAISLAQQPDASISDEDYMTIKHESEEILQSFGAAIIVGHRLLDDYSQYKQFCRSIKSALELNEQNRETFEYAIKNNETIYLTGVEIRQEQDEIVRNLQQQVMHLEQVINQTTESDDLQTLDQAYEEINTYIQNIRAKLQSIISNTDSRHLSGLTEIQKHLETVALQSQEQRDKIRPILVEKQAQNELLESSACWLIDTMRDLALISIEPVSVQYDQTLNRLSDLSNETQLKLSQVQGIKSTINNNPSFEQNRIQIIIDFESATDDINKLINGRQQVQITVQQLDQTVTMINKNVKVLRTNLENYRLSPNDIEELQRLNTNIGHEEIQLKKCNDAFSGLHLNLNETDRNEYAIHIRSVEHQIADLKQRVTYFEQLSIEHQTEYKNFEKNLKLFELNMSAFKDSVQRRLLEITIDDLLIIDNLNREVQGEETHLNALRAKYKILAPDLNNEERQHAETLINKIQIEIEQLLEQIEKRKEHLNGLLHKRQSLDQASQDIIIWYEDKQRLISPDQMIPLKTNEIERIQKKFNDTLNELKFRRITLDSVVKLGEEIKQGCSREGHSNVNLHIDELVRKLNSLEESIHDRNRQLNVANELRREFERIMTKLNELIKSTEQQIKDPLTNDLQQTTSGLKERYRTVEALIQSTKDRTNDFDDLTRIYTMISSTLNDTDRITLDEKYTLLQEKYNRLSDNLSQRLVLLDEATRERDEFDRQNEYVHEFYQQLQNDFTKLKEKSASIEDSRYDDSTSIEKRLEQFKQLLKRLDEINNSLKDLTRIQRLLTSKGHRIDFRAGGELNANLKNLEGQIHTEIERIERALQTEIDFHNLEKEIELYLQTSSEQLRSAQHQPDKGNAYQTVFDRLQQNEHALNKLIQLSERLKHEIPRSQYQQLQSKIEQSQEHLQTLIRTCQQARGEHEQMVKTQNKLNEELISINDWFKRLIHELTQPIDLNLSLNNVNDIQDSMAQLDASIDQRLLRLDQALRDEPNLISSNDKEIRERLNTVEELKLQVKNHLNKRRILLDDIHQRMTQYLKLTADIKAAICDADFKLAPFFDGYDRSRLDEHERELYFLEQLCNEQSDRLAEAHKLVDVFRPHLRNNAKELCDSQLRNFHQTIEDLETRIHQRRKELEEVRQKSIRFDASIIRLRAETDRVLHAIEKTPDNAETIILEIDSTFSALQYLGRDLKKSLDVSSSSDIDRALKDMATSVECVRDSFDRAKKSHEENEGLRDRIERILNKVKTFTNRKRQELNQSIDSGYGSIDLTRRSIEVKGFIKDVDLETSHLSEVNDLISTLAERKCDQEIILALEKRRKDLLHDLLNLKDETTKTVQTLDQQAEEQEKLRQNARAMLSIIQRTKVQLIELRPSINDEADQKLKKIDDDLSINFALFDQSLTDYKRLFGSPTDDLDKMVTRVLEDMTEIKIRFDEKESELNAYNVIRDEYENMMETILRILQIIETKTQQSHGSDLRHNLDLLKDLTNEMQTHRALIDRLQLLSSTLSAQITDTNERERVRRRLNDVIRRWTQLEQDIISEEENMEEMRSLSDLFHNISTTCERWLKQTRDLINDLTNARNVETFDQLIPIAKTVLFEYQTSFEHLQKLRTRINRLVQTNRTAEATQKLNEVDRLLNDMTVSRETLEQRLDLSQKMHFQLNEFNKQFLFYEHWLENIERTHDSISEQTLTVDEKLQRYHDIQVELDKRKIILNSLTHDYPQIIHLIAIPIQQLIGNIERIKINVTRKQEANHFILIKIIMQLFFLKEFENQYRQQKDYRGRIESLYEWLKETHRYEPLTDKRDIESLQREHARLLEKRHYIDERSNDIDLLLRTINSSNLPNDILQRLRQEIEHLKERFAESIVELETRTTFVKKTIKDVDEQQRKQRTYQESLSKLSSLVQHDHQTPGRSIEDALRSLDEQMIKFENQNEERERRKRQREREWHLYMDEINLLQDKLNTFKQRKANTQDSIEEQLHSIRMQDQELNQYQDELSHLKQHGQTMCIDDGNSMALPSEIHLLQSMITFLKEQFEQRRQYLLHAERRRDIYLNECKLFEDLFNITMERLSRSIQVASTSDQYARQLTEHKAQNEQLDEKRHQLNILYDQLDPDTRTRYLKQHLDLEKRSNDLQDRIIEQTIHYEHLLHVWREYELRLDGIRHLIDGIQQQLPITKRLLHFEQIQAAFVLFKDLKQRLIVIEPELLHLNDEIQNLCKELNGVSLQNDIINVKDNFIRIWTDVREKCDSHKSATILVNDVKRNIANLEDILGQCSIESRTRYDGDVSELKVQLERMMDVEKRLESIRDIYSNTESLIKHLASYNLYDLQSTEATLESLHRKLTALKAEILRSEHILHQNIINNLPSRQACKEMFSFIDAIKRLLDDDHGAPINNRETLQKLLRRYRDIRVEVLNHQMIIDFLNESFQQEANIDVTSIDYMEKIKQINIDWIRIKSLISARIDTLEQLSDQFNEFDQTVRTLSDWVQEQTSDLDFMRSRNMEAGAKDNLRKCDELEYQLTSKQQILSSLKSSSNRMSSTSTTFHISEQEGTLQTLRHMLDHLSPSIEQLKLKSKSIVTNWQEYNRALLQMEKLLREAEAEIDRVQTSAMNVETYEMSTRKAQDHLKAMELRRNDLEHIASQGRQLSNQCDGQTSLKINEITHRIQQQWAMVEQRLQEIVRPSREIVENWRQFNSSYVHLLDRLGELEARWYTIQREKFSSDTDTLLEKAKDFYQRLQQVDIEIIKLYERSQKLGNHLPPIVGKKIDTQYSVIKNQYSELCTLQDKLQTDCNELKHREKIYLDYLHELTQTINQAQTAFKTQLLTDENEAQNLKQLNELHELLLAKHNLIERINSNEFITCFKRAKHLHEAPTLGVLSQIKQGTYLNATNNEELKNLLEKLYETNRRLISYSDVKTQAILEKEWHDLQKSVNEIDVDINQRSEALIALLVRYNDLDRTLDNLSVLIKSIRALQQQPADELDQFISQCQNKDHELTQHRHELQRIRKTVAEISPSLHPDDSNQLMQKLSLLEIQWADAERVIRSLTDGLTKKRSEFHDFENKSKRLLEWFEHFVNVEMNHRIDGLTLEASLDMLKNELRNLIGDKRRNVNDLMITARVLQTNVTDQLQLQTIKQQTDRLEQSLNTAEEHVEKRIKKTEMIMKTFHDFDQGLENLRSWMDTIETTLQKPVSVNKLNANELRNHQQSVAAIEADIEKHSSVISSVLALGHNLLSESDVRPRNIGSIQRTIQSIEQRWLSLKDLIRKRKLELDTMNVSWRSVEEAIKRALKMITDHERFLSEVKRTCGQGLQGIRSEYKSLENFKRILDDDEKEIQEITDNYSGIIRSHQTADVNGEVRGKIKEVNTRWEVLRGTVNETMKNLKYMLSVHGDFQLTQDSLALWLTDLDVLLTNLEHLSEAPSNEKIRQLDDMDREIQEKQTKIEYVRTCANYLLSKTVDARGLTINMNELTKFCQQLRELTKRINKLKQKLINSNDRHIDSISSARSSPLHESFFSTPSPQKRISSPSPSRSRSPSRYLRSRDRFFRSYDQIEWGDQYQRAQELLADFEDILLQVNGDFLAKEETFRSETPIGIHVEDLPAEFAYTRILTTTRRKIEALREIIKQIQQELGPFLVDNLNNDPVVVDIMEKWNLLQTLAHEKDEHLKENRITWKQFKRQLEELEQAATHFTNVDTLLSRTVYSKADAHRDQVQRLDEIKSLLQLTIELADQLGDGTSEWLLVDHRLQSIKEGFEFLFARSNREHRELKTNLFQAEDIKHAMLEINSQLDHLETLTHSLEPVDERESNLGINRTKLHRFIRIHDDLEIVNERLINVNDRSKCLLSGDQLRIANDLKLMLDRLSSIKRIIRIYLERLEKLLASNDLHESFSSINHSPIRTSNSNLQRVYQ
ncbi:unnamed protein product [Rotaria socialis]|uniref:Uncharacterized protein n=1 Tax=Rotaria socialis TaxID=392032 RepID=A0A818FH57_9BILA|nr:unnamed protein product [Rotaria socialis]